ncbi:LysR family transcriptional regulator [Azospirillum thiophilum]|uniref:LysR family transcriptional regulator n=1 Tax=Azospirillum thiophilum TaxID=528244 RepID=A0AAC8W0P3_9PROT|nr:LysR substrate-binding domain-containing protein [Azospirillum thiophilum]ALG72943.1 LysR family transcriptional regulator [Azospirillum thiophilum]KJR64140.1 LysR family transcriptional regulator [Azospirillum thiophilum]
MNVRQIEAFQAVMASGSVTRAGERLSISQPAVSQLIAQFERSCGFRLFNRQGSKITPTREAEALYNEVQRMFIGVGQIARVATALRDQNWGSVSLGAFPAIARRVLPDIVWGFCEAHPDTRFRLESMRSRSLIDAVAAQHVDFGLSILPGDRPEVVSAHLHRLRGVCILPAGHHLADRQTIHAHDLANEDFVSLGPQDHSRFMIDRVFDELKVTRRSRIEAGQSETAFSFVAAKAGVAVVDPISAFNNDDTRIVVRRFEPTVEFDIWLIRPKAARSFNLVDSFVSFTLERLDLFASTLNAA